jgi:hypothetical protein
MYPVAYPDASVHLDVMPRDAEVYVDGYYAGVVDDFDGMFQRLRVEPGEHEVTLYRDGYRAFHQRAYLARVINLDRDTGISNDGIVPLQSFLDSAGGDAVAATLESNGQGNPYPVVYIRKDGSVTEHALAPDPMLDFTGPDYQAELRGVLEPVLSRAASPA